MTDHPSENDDDDTVTDVWPSDNPLVELVGFGGWIYAWRRRETEEDEPWAGMGPHAEFLVRCGGRN